MRIFKLILALAALTLAGAAHAELAIIAHPSAPVAGISKDQLGKVYLDKARSYPNGSRITPVDQSEGSAARTRFYTEALGMSERELKSYWSKLMFTGKGRPPQVVGDDAAVRDWVASNPGGIGYVDGKYVDGRVKVLLILP